MRNKVYQISLNEALFKRVQDRLKLAVIAQSEYAESRNMTTWDDPISKCLADNLFDAYESFEDLLSAIMEESKPVEIKP